MIYITGDTHGKFGRMIDFCKKHTTTKEDVMIILGDVGLNYAGGNGDIERKKLLSSLPLTFFCIHGNHEKRPSTIPEYKLTEWNGGMVYTESKYPNIYLAKDGEVFYLEGRQCLVIGGAYSVSKYFILNYGLKHGHKWFDDEQPSEEIKADVERKIAELHGKTDIVLSHTCPYKYRPVEAFLSYIDNSTVDYSTELWLDTIEESLDYKYWYCGHYHTQKVIDNLRFMYEDIDILE